MFGPSRIRIGFMGAFALLVMQGCEGCGDQVLAHCVDENGVVVDDGKCDADAGDGAAGSLADGGEADAGPAPTVAHVFVYRWWYGGHTPIGSTVPSAGGSYVHPAGGVSVGRASAVTIRGGFGTPGGVGHGAGVGE